MFVTIEGSLREDKTGVYSRGLNLQQYYSHGRYCTVDQREIFAIMCGVQSALYENVVLKVICFSLDSQATINFGRTRTEELNSANTIHLLWVTGHYFIAGNEWAEKCVLPCFDRTYPRYSNIAVLSEAKGQFVIFK